MPQVYVTTESGSTLTIEVDLPTDTVANLKVKIREKEGTEGEFQLTFNGVALEDEHTLEACGIKPEDTVVMIPEEERIEVVVHRAGEGAGLVESITLSMQPEECGRHKTGRGREDERSLCAAATVYELRTGPEHG